MALYMSGFNSVHIIHNDSGMGDTRPHNILIWNGKTGALENTLQGPKAESLLDVVVRNGVYIFLHSFSIALVLFARNMIFVSNRVRVKVFMSEKSKMLKYMTFTYLHINI